MLSRAADVFHLVEVADRLAADLQPDQTRVGVEDPADGEALHVQVCVVGQGLTQVARTDDGRGQGLSIPMICSSAGTSLPTW